LRSDNYKLIDMKYYLRFFLFILSFFLLNQLQVQGQWINRYNGLGDFSSAFNVVRTDNNGNVYLGGYADNVSAYKDMLLVKLNPAGDTVFTRIYNGSGNNVDNILDMTIDASGYIYITGYSFSANTSGDIYTAKFDSTGSLVWQVTYDGPPSKYEQGNSIAVDASGNVYVTGESDGSSSCTVNYDFITVKYDVNGSQQWAKRIDGAGHAEDKAEKIVIDNSGNCYVTGRTYNGNNFDYMTAKYNSSGVQQWVKYLDRTHNDYATDMAIDNTAGALYVTGRSKLNDMDYGTIKYDLSGNQVWTAFYNYVGEDRATQVKLDGAGNIYVTGQSDMDPTTGVNFNIVTVKYNSSGTQQWAKNFGSGSNGDDNPNAMVVDNAGNVFVAGQTGTALANDYAVLSYNPSGTMQWSKTFNGASNGDDAANGIAIDNTGNVIATGSSEDPTPQTQGATLKYNSSGAVQWTKFYNAVGDNSDNSHAIAADDSGNVYVAGYAVNYGADRNYAVLKINASGNTVWEREINGTSTGSSDEAQGIALDAIGGVYVTGYIHNSCQASDITTAKYTTQGDTAWVQRYNYAFASGTDRGYSIALDGNGNVYVTGRSDGDSSSVTNYDIITIKYNNAGVEQWVVRYNGSGNGDDEATTVRVAASGNVYVSGRTFNGTHENYVVIKYNSSGLQQWASTYISGNGDDVATAMVIDNSENVYLTGYSANANGTTTDIATVKFNSSGAQQWAKVFNGTPDGNDQGNSITLDANGNVIVTGKTDADNNVSTLNNDYVTIKYDNSGNLQWAKTYNGLGNANDEANEVTTDAAGNIYITGQSDNGTSVVQNYDYVTIKYSPSGNMSGMTTYNGTGNASDVANTLILKGNDLYVTGGSYGTNSQRDIVTIKYDVTLISVNEELKDNPDLSVYPNPATDQISINISNSLAVNDYSVVITDVTGSEMKIFLDIHTPRLTFDSKGFSKGLYFVSLKQNNRILKTTKFVII